MTKLRDTASLCGRCKKGVPASLWRVGNEIVLRKTCEVHGAQEVLISSNADWYARVTQLGAVLDPPRDVTRPVKLGCPFDCGTCTAHEQRLHLPIVEVTSACTFDCPKCWVFNKNGPQAFHMTRDELRALLAHVRTAAPEHRIVNITGGEPTQHPLFRELIEACVEEGVRRVTISTTGLRFVKDEALVARLKQLDARVILSFDSFTAAGVGAMVGPGYLEPKLEALRVLERHQVNTTLLAVLGRGVNDHELGALLDFTLEHDFIRSLELHPFAFTGQRGAGFDRGARYTTYDVLTDLAGQSRGRLDVDDFVPAPVAHPLCYQVTYLLRAGARWVPFPRFMSSAELRELLVGTLYLEPSARVEGTVRGVIDRLWSGEAELDGAAEVLGALRGLVEALTRPGVSERARLAASEACTKAVYVHTHMDEESFDTERIRQCPVGVPRPDGTNVPSCAHTILYREHDARFSTQTAAPASR